MREFLRRLLRQTDGGPGLEFGFVFPILLILVLAIVDYGLAIFQFMAVSNAAQVGANYVVLNGFNPNTIQARLSAVTGIAAANITVSELCGCPTGTAITKIDNTCTPALPRCAGDQPPGAYVTVTISEPYSAPAPGLPKEVKASSFVRILQ
jgi:Flp pilus assembly protein TadG